MPPNIEEVGARLILAGKRQFLAGLKESKTAVRDLTATTVKGSEEIAAATKAQAAATADYAKAAQASADATAKAMTAKTAAVKAAAAGDTEATAAAQRYATAMNEELLAANRAKRVALAQKVAAGAQVTALRSSQTAHDAHTASVSRSSAALSGLAKVGKLALIGGLGASAIAAYSGAKAFATYQQALEAVHTQAGLTQGRVDSLGRSLLNITGSGKIPVNPTDMANILYRIASSTSGMGYSNARLLSMTKAAAQLAVIGGPGTDTEQTARIVGGLRATGVKGAGSPQNIVALANATVGSGDLRMSDFVNFVGTGVLSSAKLAGVTLPQVAGMLALLGDNLQTGQVSGHSIAHGLQLMAAPSHIGLQAYGAIGLGGTQMGDLMRSKGLPAAIGTLMAHLNAPINLNKGTRGYLAKYLGMSNTQIAQAGHTGLTKTEQDMLLTRAFGGAKQAIPIETVLTQYDRYNRKIAQSKKLIGNFGETWKATMDEPANQLKALDAEWKTFEIRLGGPVLRAALGTVHWLQEHKTLVRDVAIGIGVLLIPATAAYIGMLATRGVNTVGTFLGLMKGTNTEVGRSGTLAAGQAGGMGTFGKAVMGVTAAIGIWELGKATAGHGTAGLVTAGLGGAVAGMVAGFAIGGPFGAAIGAAGGAILGLASNFYAASNAAHAADKATQGWMTTSYKADKFRVGAQFSSALTSQLQSTPALASILANAGVKTPQILADIRQGNVNGPAGLQLQAAFMAGKINQAQFTAGMNGLQSLVTNFGDIVNNLDDIATISGQVSQHMNDEKASAVALTQLVFAQPHRRHRNPQKPTLGSILGNGLPHKASGGPVSAGELYRVNESGVELFMPHVDGTIVAHGQHAGGSLQVVNLHLHGAFTTPEQIYAAAKSGLADAMAGK